MLARYFVRVIGTLMYFCLVDGKIYEICELAHELQSKHRLPVVELATWVCIAKHSSGLNSTAHARGTALTGGSHGLFQISDVYWCSPSDEGLGCNVPCARLRDDDLSDDIACVRQIYDEHKRLTGDGFNAWQAYKPFCQHNAKQYLADCLDLREIIANGNNYISYHSTANEIEHYVPTRKKIYSRCELAQELAYKHQMPKEQIPTWVCIAQHESLFDTSAIGRLNVDGSRDHGLFQISDLYWCSHDRWSDGKACGLHCSKLLDEDITDDVHCVKRIFNEHTRISGDGFDAWAVYDRDCRDQQYEHIADCFNEVSTTLLPTKSEAITDMPVQQYIKNPFIQLKNPTHSNVNAEFTQKAPTNLFLQSHAQQTAHPNAIIAITQKTYTSPFQQQPLGPLHKQQTYQTSYTSSPFLTSHPPAYNQHPNAIDAPLKPSHSHQRYSYASIYNRNPFLKNQNTPNSLTQSEKPITHHQQLTTPTPIRPIKRKGKVYKRCELAQEMYFKHKFPIQDIAIWVCIAEHESNYDTSAIGQFNPDDSKDYGLFQISDRYWCTNDIWVGKGCSLQCEKLLDEDLTDDAHCIRTIYDEHTRISGDGFTAWMAYERNCREHTVQHITDCFDASVIKQAVIPALPTENENELQRKAVKGKIYKPCELAQELFYKHKMPMDMIPTWVCIAKHESSFNTAAIGRLNVDGSSDFGLFQISELYWCSTNDEASSKACNIPCYKLLDNDISDDVHCIKIIYAEHTRISGDGFSAWAVYQPYCQQQQLNHLNDCFDDNTLEMTALQASPRLTTTTTTRRPLRNFASNHAYGANPFLNQYNATSQSFTIKKTTILPSKLSTAMLKNYTFSTNPFLNQYNVTVQPFNVERTTALPGPQPSKLLNAVIKNHSFGANPFLNQYNVTVQPFNVETTTALPGPQPSKLLNAVIKNHTFGANPFLNQYNVTVQPLQMKTITALTSPQPSKLPIAVVRNHPYGANPFLNKYNLSQLHTTTAAPLRWPAQRLSAPIVKNYPYDGNIFVNHLRPQINVKLNEQMTDTQFIKKNYTRNSLPPKYPIKSNTLPEMEVITTDRAADKQATKTTDVKTNITPKFFTDSPRKPKIVTQTNKNNQYNWSATTVTTARQPIYNRQFTVRTTAVPIRYQGSVISTLQNGTNKITDDYSLGLITTTKRPLPVVNHINDRNSRPYTTLRTTATPNWSKRLPEKMVTTKIPYNIHSTKMPTKRPNPFDQPFFAKYRDIFEDSKRVQHVQTPTSPYYEKFRNNMLKNSNTKTIYAYGFGQNQTLFNRHEFQTRLTTTTTKKANTIKATIASRSRTRSPNWATTPKGSSSSLSSTKYPSYRKTTNSYVRPETTTSLYDFYLNWNKQP